MLELLMQACAFAQGEESRKKLIYNLSQDRTALAVIHNDGLKIQKLTDFKRWSQVSKLYKVKYNKRTCWKLNGYPTWGDGRRNGCSRPQAQVMQRTYAPTYLNGRLIIKASSRRREIRILNLRTLESGLCIRYETIKFVSPPKWLGTPLEYSNEQATSGSVYSFSAKPFCWGVFRHVLSIMIFWSKR